MTTKKRSTKTAAKASKAKKTKAKPAGKSASQARPAPKAAAKRTSAAKATKGAKKKTVDKKAAAKKKASSRKSSRKATKAARPRAVPAKQAKRVRPSTFSAALKLYESGLKLAHSEKFEPAKDKFKELIEQFPGESELLDRAHILIQACDKRILGQRSRPRLKTADDFYEVGVTELNGRRLDEAREHLERALKLEPKADYVLYALAAVSCLGGERDAALAHLKRAIEYRDQNRFLAAYDFDFASLSDDPEFIALITSE